MVSNQFQRFNMLVGEEALALIAKKRVIVFGVGGVGGQAAESLVRAGFGHLTIVDRDIIDITNINRQIVALHSKVGKDKVTTLKERLLDINPNLDIVAIKNEINADTLHLFELDSFDFVVDAIDSIYDKLTLISYCNEHDIPMISSMGAGNRFDPTKVIVTDVFKTNYDPFAKVIRSQLRRLGVKKLAVVASSEIPQKTGHRTPASSPFVPPAFGLAIARYVFNYFIHV